MRALNRYELNKINKKIIYFAICLSIIYLIFLLFFSLIGRLETATNDMAIFSEFKGIIALSVTIATFITTVYGAITINQFIVNHYIKNNRMRVYIYPNGRSPLFLSKYKTFISAFSLYQIIALCIATLGYTLINLMTHFVLITFSDSLSALIIMIIAVILGDSFIIMSSLIGIKCSSKIATLITAILFIICFGNLLVLSIMNNISMTVIVTITLFILSIIGIYIMAKRIDTDEV